MKKDLIRYAASNLLKRRLRSFLMAISILIGITAIFALLSFGQGLERYMDVLANQMGKDKIILQPKGFSPTSGVTSFNQADIDFVGRINGVQLVAGMMFETVEVTYKRDERPRFVYLMGMPPSSGEEGKLVEELMTVEPLAGRTLKKSDQFKVVLGYSYSQPDTIFDRGIPVGDKITINGIPLEIVGIYDKIGNPQDDSNVYMTVGGFELLIDEEDNFDWVVIRSAVGEDPSLLAEKISEKLRKRRGLREGNEDFTVQTFEDLIETFGAIITGLNGVLVLIALISLVIAGVNIMNTMYTAVLERTNEIGIMKAIGARNKEIRNIFVVESGLLALVGGLLGVLLGYVIAKIGGYAAASAGYSFLEPIFPWWLTFGCLLFSFLVGIFAGYLPARQASKQKPVESLQYE